MKVPGIEEMVETLVQASFEGRTGESWAELTLCAPNTAANERAAAQAGLLAVFETHVREMLIAVYLSGGGSYASADQYVNRILAQLKEPRHD